MTQSHCPNARCDAAWDQSAQRQCPKCGALSSVPVRTWPEETSQVHIPSPSRAMQNAPRFDDPVEQRVIVTSISLTWGDAFAIGFKFMVVFAIFQAVFFVIAIMIWG